MNVNNCPVTNFYSEQVDESVFATRDQELFSREIFVMEKAVFRKIMTNSAMF